jgi:hypothetical protein
MKFKANALTANASLYTPYDMANNKKPFEVKGLYRNWRREGDSNPRQGLTCGRFPGD